LMSSSCITPSVVKVTAQGRFKPWGRRSACRRLSVRVNESSLYGFVRPSPTQEGCLPFYSARGGLVTSCIPNLPLRVGRRRVVERCQRYFVASPFPCSARPRSSPAGSFAPPSFWLTCRRACSFPPCRPAFRRGLSPRRLTSASPRAHGSGFSRFALKCRPSRWSPR
jgi:hypothetical protein